MADEKIFSAHEHLNAVLNASALIFERSENTSDLIVAGVLRAVQSRLDYLNELIKLRGEATDPEYMCILLNERVQELGIDNNVLHNTIQIMEANLKEMEAKLALVERLYGPVLNKNLQVLVS